jgi:hypothetical protein
MHWICLFGFLCAAYWRLGIQLPLRDTYSLLCQRVWTLPGRSPITSSQWGWWTDWRSTSTTTWRAVHDTVFNIALCKIHCRRCNISCGVHQVRLGELGWDTISLNGPGALCIHFGNTVLHTARRVKVASSGSQSRGTNLESRWIVRYWYNCKKLCCNLSSARA